MNLEDSMQHPFSPTQSNYAGGVGELKIIDELVANVSSPTAFLDVMRRKYAIDAEKLMLLAPALVSRASNQNQLLERKFDGREIKYIEFEKAKLEHYHELDFIIGFNAAIKYAEYTGICSGDEFKKQISKGKVGEFMLPAGYAAGKVERVRGVQRTRIYLLSEVNNIVVTAQVPLINDTNQEPSDGRKEEKVTFSIKKTSGKVKSFL